MFLKFDIFQGHGTKVKVSRSADALDTKTAVTLTRFEVLRRNKTEMHGEQISFVAMPTKFPIRFRFIFVFQIL